MSIAEKSPTLARVLGALPPDRKKILFQHMEAGAFHRGRQWFGTGMHVPMQAVMNTASTATVPLMALADAPCPVAAAFHVERDESERGWYSAKINGNLMEAIRHIIEFAGNREDGMEQYLKELENTNPLELSQFILAQYDAVSTEQPPT